MPMHVRKRFTRIYFASLTAVMMLAGLGGCSATNSSLFKPNTWAYRGSEDEPIVLDVSGPVAIDVESFNGDVMITANPKLTNAQVTLSREGVQGQGRTTEAKESLVDISCVAEIVPGELGQKLQVRTSTTYAEPYFQRAHLLIELPEVDGIKVRTTNGRVFARNITGTVDVSTSYGEVRIMTPQPMTHPVTIIDNNGDINYRIRAESTALIDAQTVNGEVRHIVHYGTLIVKPGSKSDTLHALLNDGKNPVMLRTVNGDINIAVVSNPEDVGVFLLD